MGNAKRQVVTGEYFERLRAETAELRKTVQQQSAVLQAKDVEIQQLRSDAQQTHDYVTACGFAPMLSNETLFTRVSRLAAAVLTLEHECHELRQHDVRVVMRCPICDGTDVRVNAQPNGFAWSCRGNHKGADELGPVRKSILAALLAWREEKNQQ